MKHFLVISLMFLGTLLCGEAFAQRVTNSNYRTIGHAPGIPLFWAAWYFFF